MLKIDHFIVNKWQKVYESFLNWKFEKWQKDLLKLKMYFPDLYS